MGRAWRARHLAFSGAAGFRGSQVQIQCHLPARVEQVLLATDDGAALPWPPPAPGTETWRREAARYTVAGPTEVDQRWSTELTLHFDGKTLPAEFLVACSHAQDVLEVMESPASPRGAGCLVEPGPDATSFIVTVRPTSRVNYDRAVLQVTCFEAIRIEKVERLFRP